MTQKDYLQNLLDALALLDEAAKWLERSYSICRPIMGKEDLNAEEYDAAEAFTSRFARVSDMIIQKVFRAIDRAEFEDRGTLIDCINRAHKRKLIESVDLLREIRELRNEIVHEYTGGTFKEIFKNAVRLTPDILKITNDIRGYCSKYKTD